MERIWLFGEKRKGIPEKGNMGKILELEMHMFWGTVKNTVLLGVLFCFLSWRVWDKVRLERNLNIIYLVETICGFRLGEWHDDLSTLQILNWWQCSQ